MSETEDKSFFDLRNGVIPRWKYWLLRLMFWAYRGKNGWVIKL